MNEEDKGIMEDVLLFKTFSRVVSGSFVYTIEACKAHLGCE